MIAPITLPGDIDGLLCTGAQVVARYRDLEEPGGPEYGGRGTVLATPMPVDGTYSVHYRYGGVDCIEEIAPADIVLDLRAGADIAARWLARRLAMHPIATITSPQWRRWTPFDQIAWVLDCGVVPVAGFAGQNLGYAFRARPWPDNPFTFSWRPSVKAPPACVCVPSLADIDPADPDADLLALRAVVLLVAGRA